MSLGRLLRQPLVCRRNDTGSRASFATLTSPGKSDIPTRGSRTTDVSAKAGTQCLLAGYSGSLLFVDETTLDPGPRSLRSRRPGSRIHLPPADPLQLSFVTLDTQQLRVARLLGFKT